MAKGRRAGRASKVPRELHETDLSLIFEKLPVPVLWQVRVTCRVWRDAVYADKRMAEVLKRRQSGSGGSMFVQVLDRGKGPHDVNDLRSLKYALAHDPVRNAWCPTLLFWHWGFHVARNRRITFDGTAGGLVVFHDASLDVKMRKTELQVFVTNPLTNKVKELPVLHRPTRTDVNVRMVPGEDGGYKVVAVVTHWDRQNGDFILVFVFDSARGAWSPGASFPNSYCKVEVGPSFNGSVYCYLDDYNIDEENVSIWRFNVKENKWSEVVVPAKVMRKVVSCELVEHWGRLLMVAGTEILNVRDREAPTIEGLSGIKVWEVIVVDSKMQGPSSAPLTDLSGEESSASSFAETTYVWNLLGKMQQSFLKQFLRKFEQYRFPRYAIARLKVFDLVAVDHCIYLSIDVSSSGTGKAGRKFRPAVL